MWMPFIFSSFLNGMSYMPSCGFRLSVNICADCFFSQTNCLITTKFAHMVPSGPASSVCSRSRSKVAQYGHFCDFTKIASSPRQKGWITIRLAQDCPHVRLHAGCAQGEGQGVVHMIWALLSLL